MYDSEVLEYYPCNKSLVKRLVSLVKSGSTRLTRLLVWTHVWLRVWYAWFYQPFLVSLVKSYLKSLVKLVSARKLEPEKPGNLGFTRLSGWVWLKHRTWKVGLDGFSQTFRVSVVGKHNLKSQVGLVSPGFQVRYGWQILPGKQGLAWFSQ